MNGTSRREADPIAQWAAVVLVVVAFAGSFFTVQSAVSGWGVAGVMSFAIAAMPEITVGIGLRRVFGGTANWFVWVALISSGAFTLLGNLAEHTGHTDAWKPWAAVVVAVWPAYSVVLALGLAGLHSKDKEATDDAEDETTTRTAVSLQVGRQTTRTPKPRVTAPRPQVAQEVTAEVIDAEPLTPGSDLVVRPEVKAREPRAIGAQGQDDPVASALLAEWTPGQPLTRDIKVKVMAAAQTSESTVKRTAKALAVSAEVTS